MLKLLHGEPFNNTNISNCFENGDLDNVGMCDWFTSLAYGMAFYV